jgi:hypothetical protein
MKSTGLHSEDHQLGFSLLSASAEPASNKNLRINLDVHAWTKISYNEATEESLIASRKILAVPLVMIH